MGAQGASHLNLSFVVLVPVLMWFVDRVLWDQRGSPWRWGVAFGLVALAQLLISSEILATAALFAGVTALVVVVHLWRSARDRLGARLKWFAKSAGAGAVVFLSGAAYPLWMALAGPQEIAGHETSNPSFLSANLLGFVLPSSHQRLTIGLTRSLVDPHFVGGFLGENTTYIGIPLLLASAVIAVVLRRLPIVRVALVGAVLAAVLSLGARLLVADQAWTGRIMPYAWLHRLPLFNDVIPARLALYVDLYCGLLLAVGADRLRRFARRAVEDARAGGIGRTGMFPRSRAAWGPAAPGLLVACLVPLLPNWPVHMQDARVPKWFGSAGALAVRPGSVVAVYPFPRVTHADAMLWQAEAGMRFKMLGGFVLTPDGRGSGSEYGTGKGPIEELFSVAYWGDPPLQETAARLESVRAELRRENVDTVVVARRGKDPGGAETAISSALHARPIFSGGVWVFYHVSHDLRAITEAAQEIPRLHG
jgi:hypothetical protein